MNFFISGVSDQILHQYKAFVRNSMHRVLTIKIWRDGIVASTSEYLLFTLVKDSSVGSVPVFLFPSREKHNLIWLRHGLYNLYHLSLPTITWSYMLEGSTETVD